MQEPMPGAFLPASSLSVSPALMSLPKSGESGQPETAHPLFNAMTAVRGQEGNHHNGNSSNAQSSVATIKEGNHHHGNSSNAQNSVATVTILDQISRVQQSIMEMSGSQERLETSLREFIQQELQGVQSSLMSQVQTFRAECLDKNEEIQKVVQQSDNRLEVILNREPHSEPKTHGDGAMNGEYQDVERVKEVQEPEPQPKAELHTQSSLTWDEFQEAVEEFDPNCVYHEILELQSSKRGMWHHIFGYFGYAHLVRTSMPDTWLASLTEHWVFLLFQTLLIATNTMIMGYETDVGIKAALEVPKGDVPAWLDTCNLVFNLTFLAELMFRIAVLRSWFFVSPSEWGWNLFDGFLVVTSLISDMMSGINLSFIRTLRILRAVRVARIIRVLKFFRPLRQMLFAILACLSSLLWAFLFLGMIMFMFSILFLQGAANTLDDLDWSTEADRKFHADISEWFSSLGDSCLSLLATTTGGADWLALYHVLNESGFMYSMAYVLYIVFVTTGVMNVLTGVFLSNANEFIDVDLIVQNEKVRIENFCLQMLQIFRQLDPDETGFCTWEMFNKAMAREDVRAYLSSFCLEPTHVRLIFDLLDEKRSGTIKLDEFVMGMVRLKGEAKSVDARIIQREIGMIPSILKDHHIALKNHVAKTVRESSSTF